MSKLRGALKKVGKKAAKTAKTAAKAAAVKRVPGLAAIPRPTRPTPPKEEDTKMEDQETQAKLEELEDANAKLVEQNAKLRKIIEGHEAKQTAKDSADAPVKWKRGTLPGDRYIKTDIATGKWKDINKAEWDALA